MIFLILALGLNATMIENIYCPQESKENCRSNSSFNFCCANATAEFCCPELSYLAMYPDLQDVTVHEKLKILQSVVWTLAYCSVVVVPCFCCLSYCRAKRHRPGQVFQVGQSLPETVELQNMAQE